MEVISIDFSAGSFILSDAFTIPSPTGLTFIKDLTGSWFANSFPELIRLNGVLF